MPSAQIASWQKTRPAQFSSAFYRARHADCYAECGIAIMRWRSGLTANIDSVMVAPHGK
jgi:hypothetical protein